MIGGLAGSSGIVTDHRAVLVRRQPPLNNPVHVTGTVCDSAVWPDFNRLTLIHIRPIVLFRATRVSPMRPALNWLSHTSAQTASSTTLSTSQGPFARFRNGAETLAVRGFRLSTTQSRLVASSVLHSQPLTRIRHSVRRENRLPMSPLFRYTVDASTNDQPVLGYNTPSAINRSPLHKIPLVC